MTCRRAAIRERPIRDPLDLRAHHEALARLDTDALFGDGLAGSRRASRPTWLVGSLIMGVVLAKLLLVDRTYIGNLQGIISFIVVGLLFTTVGYFAPTPPREVPAGSAA